MAYGADSIGSGDAGGFVSPAVRSRLGSFAA
jgi:hypothetical protein